MVIYKPLYIGLGIARTKHWKSAFMLDPKNLHNSQNNKNLYSHSSSKIQRAVKINSDRKLLKSR